MPAEPRYPGRYVEEAVGPPPIAGVATSITAFVGRAVRGPVETPTTVRGFADFERIFGGVWTKSSLGPSVRDFFDNGGSTAVILRLYRARATESARAVLSVDTLTLEAASSGAWGNELRARVDEGTRPPNPAQGETATSLFTLTIRDGATGVVERFPDVVVAPTEHPRHVATVLARESTLVRVRSHARARPRVHADPVRPGTSVWDDVAPPTCSRVARADHASDGLALNARALTGGGRAGGRGLYALDRADLLNLLVIPPYTASGDVGAAVIGAAAAYCEQRRAMLILDGPAAWSQPGQALSASTADLGTDSPNAAVYFPRLRAATSQGQPVAVAGAVAGVIARTDATHGVWHAPAGLHATIAGTPGVALTEPQIGTLSRRGVNCVRTQRGAGTVLWGARTLQGAEGSTSEWRYVPVRRTALFIEESLARGTQWAAFEPNYEALWARLRGVVESFLYGLFQQGAFAGAQAKESYFVHCGRDTTTPADLASGQVVIEVGFAPLKPAEFIVIRVRVATAQ